MTNPLYDSYQILQKVYGRGSYLKQAIAETFIEEINRARTVKIVYGVLENDIYLDFCIKSFAPKNPKLPVRILLKIALYMLLFMEKQRYMVTDNAVALAKKLGKGGAAGFINAFLRAFDAEKLTLPQGKIAALSVQYSYPAFAVSRLVKEYGGEEAEKIMQHRPPRTFVRFASAEAAEPYLQSAEKTPFENVYSFSNFRRGEGFAAGKYTFQSIGSVAICAAVEPCENLLDACAAPGGKSVLLSQKCGRVTAFELHEHRAELIKQYAARMGAENIEIICRDSSVYDGAYAEKFDAVLVDAPCSGFGVVSDNPDIKFFRKEESLAEIEKTQLAILSACAKYVKKGGHLYYSTCSVLGEENGGTVSRFLQTCPDFAPEKAESPLAHRDTEYGMQFLPHLSMGAGFYVCKLRRRGV